MASSTLDLKNIGKAPVVGVTNRNVLPPALQNTTSMGVKAKAPSSGVQKPPTTLPANQTVKTGSAGAYKGVDIKPGTDAEVAAQISRIDNPQPNTVGVSTPPAPQKNTPTVVEAPKPSQPTYPGIIGDLIKKAQEGSVDVQRANNALTDFRRNAIEYEKGIYSAPTSARVMQGRDAQVQAANAARENALAAGVTNALANQGQQITALNNAGTLAQPVQIAPGSTLSNPLDGSTIAGGLGGYANFQTAEQVMGLIRQYPDAQYVYDQTKTPQENLQAFQSTALQRSPTYQKSTYGQPGATSLLGGAGLTSAVDLKQKASEIQAISNGAEANFNLLVNTAQQGGVNDLNVPILNRLQQNVSRGLTSDSAVALFRATLESVRAQYASILGGGTTTDQSRNAAAQQIPDDISLAALKALESQLKFEAQNRVAGFEQQIQALTAGQGQTGGQTTQINGRTYVKVNGGWQLQR